MIIRRENRKDECYSVAVTLGRKATKGDVGIEVELEASNTMPKSEDVIPPQWVYHQDGSLRGYDNAEYVLAKPLPFDEVDKAIDDLWDVLKAKKVKLTPSNRTSVHVHLNVQDFFLNRLATFAGMYFCVEEILTEWCGEYRVGNLFCLRAKDAPAIITQLRRFIRSDMQTQIRDNFHYAGFNANALHKFGSIEIRTLRGVMDPETIKMWVAILRRLHTLSADFPDPREFVSMFSSLGPLEFYETLLGEHAGTVQAAIGWSNEQVRDSMYEGIRLAQDICYCRDWAKFQAIEVKPDPFGRDVRKKASKNVASPVAQPVGFMEDMPEPDWDPEEMPQYMDEGEPVFDPHIPQMATQAIPVQNVHQALDAFWAQHHG